MANIIQIPSQDQWQFRVDVYRKPDGAYVAVLVDARVSLIEAGDMSPADKLRQMADMLENGAVNMRLTADDIEF